MREGVVEQQRRGLHAFGKDAHHRQADHEIGLLARAHGELVQVDELADLRRADLQGERGRIDAHVGVPARGDLSEGLRRVVRQPARKLAVRLTRALIDNPLGQIDRTLEAFELRASGAQRAAAFVECGEILHLPFARA